eukprot:symbB.v1.2.027802.t1/scaffold2881.1/size68116/7
MAIQIARVLTSLQSKSDENAAKKKTQNRFLLKCKEVKKQKLILTQTQHAQRALADTYIQKHAVRKSDMALAIAATSNVKAMKVKGKGRYKTWNPAMMLKSTLGHGPRFSATGSHVPTQYDKTPCVFSQRAMAYWLEASSGYVGQVRDAICEVFTEKVQNGVARLHTAKPLISSVALEFDASSFRLRQRIGLLEVDAKYYCFVQKLQVMVLADCDGSWSQTSIPISPCVLDQESAECMWEAIHKRWAACSKVFVLKLISDQARSNVRLTKAFFSPLKPSNCILLHKLCDMHQLNHAAEPVWRGLKQLSPMFYTVGFMSTGSNYYRLLLAAFKWVMHPSTVVVNVREKPDEATIERNRAFLKLTLKMTESESQLHAMQDLLKMDSGHWGGGTITHHCV